jgi:DNA-binding NarL/FixJ family response regulator
MEKFARICLLFGTNMQKITILLADDHNIIRHGIRALLTLEADFEIVGEAVTGREAIALTEQLAPNVVVMDLSMPLLNGMEAARQISLNCPETKVIVLSAHDDKEHVGQAMVAGAAGYLLKLTAAQELIEAIREVNKGNVYFSPQVAKRLRDAADPFAPKIKASAALTVREAEVLQLVAEGFVNKQIADELHLSIKTVEKHRQSMMHKLNLHCIADLVRHAAAKGVVDTHDVNAVLHPA